MNCLEPTYKINRIVSLSRGGDISTLAIGSFDVYGINEQSSEAYATFFHFLLVRVFFVLFQIVNILNSLEYREIRFFVVL